MRTTEERTRLIRKRTAELKRGQQRRKQRVWDCVCVAACLLLVVGLGVWMPEWLSSPVSHSPAGTASLMGSHGALGYIVSGGRSGAVSSWPSATPASPWAPSFMCST